MNWKEQFEKEFKPSSNCQRHWSDDFSLACTCDRDESHEAYLFSKFKTFISTEIVEKLINDIPTHVTKSYARGYTKISIPTASIKQQLKDKWLNN